MTWFLEDLSRFARERSALEELAVEPWLLGCHFRLVAGGALELDADLAIGEAVRGVTVRYPAHFPVAPPYVKPRGSAVRWSVHQYGPAGELCLEIRPDNWEPCLTAADMLRSAHRLLATEGGAIDGAPLEVANAHRVSLGQTARSTWVRLLATAAFKEFVAGQASPVAIKCWWTYNDAAMTLIPTAEAAEGGWCDRQVPALMRRKAWMAGHAIALAADDPS